MKLKLSRPIVFFDLETTGTNVSTDRIVEISLVKLMPNGEVKSKTRRINPQMPIPQKLLQCIILQMPMWPENLHLHRLPILLHR